MPGLPWLHPPAGRHRFRGSSGTKPARLGALDDARRFPEAVYKALPGAVVTPDPCGHPDGDWWFDVEIGNFATCIRWNRARGFTVYPGKPGIPDGASETFIEAGLAVDWLRKRVGGRMMAAE